MYKKLFVICYILIALNLLLSFNTTTNYKQCAIEEVPEIFKVENINYMG